MTAIPNITDSESITPPKDIPIIIASATYQKKDHETSNNSHTHRITLVECNNQRLYFDQEESDGTVPLISLDEFNAEVNDIEQAKKQILETTSIIIEDNRKKYFDSNGMIMLKGCPVFEQEFLQQKFQSLKKTTP